MVFGHHQIKSSVEIPRIQCTVHVHEYVYAMAFSTGLNGLQVEEVNKKKIVEVLGRHSLLPANSSPPVAHAYSTPSKRSQLLG